MTYPSAERLAAVDRDLDAFGRSPGELRRAVARARAIARGIGDVMGELERLAGRERRRRRAHAVTERQLPAIAEMTSAPSPHPVASSTAPTEAPPPLDPEDLPTNKRTVPDLPAQIGERPIPPEGERGPTAPPSGPHPTPSEVERAAPHDVQVERAAPHDVQVERAAPHDVQVERAAPHDVQVERAAPHDLPEAVETPAASRSGPDGEPEEAIEVRISDLEELGGEAASAPASATGAVRTPVPKRPPRDDEPTDVYATRRSRDERRSDLGLSLDELFGDDSGGASRGDVHDLFEDEPLRLSEHPAGDPEAPEPEPAPARGRPISAPGRPISAPAPGEAGEDDDILIFDDADGPAEDPEPAAAKDEAAAKDGDPQGERRPGLFRRLLGR
ncbi:MAG: hypothetical protein ACFCGT_28355 [Sandaracinaceae bacterium]